MNGKVLYWLAAFAACYIGGWMVLAFVFWQIMPESPTFFRVWVIPSACGASVALALRTAARKVQP